MSHILRALVVWALLFAGCVAVFTAFAWWSQPSAHWLEVGGTILGGAIAAWFAVQFGRAAWKRLRERVAVGRADEVVRPQDGARVVVRGVLTSTSPLTTPFSGRPAVAYGYKAWRREQTGPSRKTTSEVAYWWGEGSTPCTLLTPHGALEVRSRLELDLWSSLVDNTPEARAGFDRFLAGVRPDVTKAGIVRPGFAWDTPLDGTLRRDRVRQPDPPPLADLFLHEWAVAPDEPVVLMGRYSAARGGLVHDERTGRPLRVLKGSVETVRSQLRQGAIGYGVAALLALGVAAVFAGSLKGAI